MPISVMHYKIVTRNLKMVCDKWASQLLHFKAHFILKDIFQNFGQFQKLSGNNGNYIQIVRASFLMHECVILNLYSPMGLHGHMESGTGITVGIGNYFTVQKVHRAI